jgi:hypothetical protein
MVAVPDLGHMACRRVSRVKGRDHRGNSFADLNGGQRDLVELAGQLRLAGIRTGEYTARRRKRSQFPLSLRAHVNRWTRPAVLLGSMLELSGFTRGKELDDEKTGYTD